MIEGKKKKSTGKSQMWGEEEELTHCLLPRKRGGEKVVGFQKKDSFVLN